MPTVHASAIVPATAENTFSFIADYRNIPHLQPHFTTARLLTAHDKGVGAELALEGKFHGIPMHVRNRIIAYVEPVRLVSISDGTVMSRSTWDIEQLSTDPPSTRVTLTIDYKLRDGHGGLLKGISSALWPIFNREVQGMTNDSLHRLQTLLTEKS